MILRVVRYRDLCDTWWFLRDLVLNDGALEDDDLWTELLCRPVQTVATAGLL